jgi:hypothetical protein
MQRNDVPTPEKQEIKNEPHNAKGRGGLERWYPQDVVVLSFESERKGRVYPAAAVVGTWLS